MGIRDGDTRPLALSTRYVAQSITVPAQCRSCCQFLGSVRTHPPRLSVVSSRVASAFMVVRRLWVLLCRERKTTRPGEKQHQFGVTLPCKVLTVQCRRPCDAFDVQDSQDKKLTRARSGVSRQALSCSSYTQDGQSGSRRVNVRVASDRVIDKMQSRKMRKR